MSENATDITNDNIQDNNGNDSLLQVEACMKAALTSTRITYLLPSHSLYVEESESFL